jgi:hypothetical protein
MFANRLISRESFPTSKIKYVRRGKVEGEFVFRGEPQLVMWAALDLARKHAAQLRATEEAAA